MSGWWLFSLEGDRGLTFSGQWNGGVTRGKFITDNSARKESNKDQNKIKQNGMPVLVNLNL
jgi:hypothetical protein